MIDNHYDVHDAHVYDATNPKARDFYWKNLDGKLLAMGWDAFGSTLPNRKNTGRTGVTPSCRTSASRSAMELSTPTFFR